MYQVEATTHRPYATKLQKQPALFLVQPWMQANDIVNGGELHGKFGRWVKKAVKKLPQIAAGGAAGYFTGGGWEGAAAGGITATIAKRKKGFVLKSIGKGAAYGAAAGAVVGVAKETIFTGPGGTFEGDSGIMGKVTRLTRGTGEFAPVKMLTSTNPQPISSPVEPGVLARQGTDISWGEKAVNFFTPLTAAILTKSPQQVMNGAAAEAAYVQAQYANPYFPDVTQYNPGIPQQYEYVEGEYLPGGDMAGGGYGGGYGGSALAEEGEMAPPEARANIMAGPIPYIAIGGVGLIVLMSLIRGR